MKIFFFCFSLSLYLVVWSVQEKSSRWDMYSLSSPPPASFLKVVTGYGSEMVGFSLFVKVSIFSGGSYQGISKESYADDLANNFQVMTELFPSYRDSYQFCQSFLSPLGGEYTRAANVILEQGSQKFPDDIILPFFKAFNLFYYLDDPYEAGKLFFSLSKKDNAPPIFGSLAGTLMGKGGKLQAGYDILLAMYRSEHNDALKEKYLRSIENFKHALQVEAAVQHFEVDHGHFPNALSDLVPDYIGFIPELSGPYIIVYDQKIVRIDTRN